MRRYDNLYCKLFIAVECEIDYLIKSLLHITNGYKKLTRTIVTDFGEVDVNKNKEFDSERKDNDFLYSKFILDIEPNEKVTQEQYILKINELTMALRDREFIVVAACDFEDELK